MWQEKEEDLPPFRKVPFKKSSVFRILSSSKVNSASSKTIGHGSSPLRMSSHMAMRSAKVDLVFRPFTERGGALRLTAAPLSFAAASNFLSKEELFVFPVCQASIISPALRLTTGENRICISFPPKASQSPGVRAAYCSSCSLSFFSLVDFSHEDNRVAYGPRLSAENVVLFGELPDFFLRPLKNAARVSSRLRSGFWTNSISSSRLPSKSLSQRLADVLADRAKASARESIFKAFPHPPLLLRQFPRKKCREDLFHPCSAPSPPVF